MQGVEGEELGRDGLGVYLCMYGIRGLEQNMYYVVRILCSQQGNPVITNVYACYMYGEKKSMRGFVVPAACYFVPCPLGLKCSCSGDRITHTQPTRYVHT